MFPQTDQTECVCRVRGVPHLLTRLWLNQDVDLLLCMFVKTHVTPVPEKRWVCAAVSLTPHLCLYICISTTDVRMSIKQEGKTVRWRSLHAFVGYYYQPVTDFCMTCSWKTTPIAALRDVSLLHKIFSLIYFIQNSFWYKTSTLLQIFL